MRRGTEREQIGGEAFGLWSRRRAIQAGLAAVGLAACEVESPIDLQDIEDAPRFEGCDPDLNTNFMIAETAPDAIESLDDPVWVQAGQQSIPSYLYPEARIIGIQVDGQAYAIPLSVLWHHEIVNLDPPSPLWLRLAITYCPLTGSSLVFDRSSVGSVTIGVSGIIFMNNLMLFDRSGPDASIWSQMLAAAVCGPQTGAKLGRFPFVEMKWPHWLELHPSTLVLAGDQGYDPVVFDYTELGYPYGVYRESEPFWRAATTMPPPDRRRFSKERVVGVPPTASDPGIAFPFAALTERDGPHQVVEFTYDGDAAVVLWSDEAQGGMAFRPVTESGDTFTLRATNSGFEDEETGSGWTVDGRAVSGPMDRTRLLAIEQTHTAFWGAWAAFHPDTRLWEWP